MSGEIDQEVCDIKSVNIIIIMRLSSHDCSVHVWAGAVELQERAACHQSPESNPKGVGWDGCCVCVGGRNLWVAAFASDPLNGWGHG